ncbi:MULTISPECIES: ABC transporter ATP-binding protein [Romboutsia]|uniref:Maltodextrin import ATP-binding protein MsmX n=1 Tax=Romboutsia hominis TaxID=1507512 RepID=A0A2P2BSW4_9FIRM|nr:MULTISPECIES: sn-glycerol-3-phosphate ABC transporter ATP-binding protein UgpC [Romboutsia]MCH1960706.1 sn-glycerol-3-phosphate ABC transporter ATP-binding protein UgpC [Romboutsia hominis]MCH1968862.1 sn-glycerol-3-phosphate ABC transporter ATP-binding protein UgpC [Romboutsia hominis]MDB8793619.1 sn-glycerol-3-phosphate ABC transporter ATP-binding protein UgpC [Romboutsia sp. 1001216sp1]MDB8795016.1 sn-glycerol-3-phosphate ABC transporter ATP-binding protein UgpC [Romboutsia sp. 1001216sp1
MAKVILKNICKSYSNGFNAVKNVNIDIQDKEFVVLVGPSGCGKSTTLRMIAGLEEISDGELYIGENLVNDVDPKDRDIAMVFQNYALYPHLTVYENMAFALKLRKLPKDEIDKKVRDAAKILDLDQLLDRKPKALSGGQRQRVALGRAIVRNPKVFLMDEPLSNLDAKLRTSMRTEITKLHKSLGTTFIYVTHDQVEAMTMADRIVVMKDGIVQQIDTPQEIYDKPNNMFVAGFIGAPQMNFINVILTEVNGEIHAKADGFDIALNKGESSSLIEKGYIGKEVVLGIRPEDIHMEDIFVENSLDSTFEATVELGELMGAEIYAYLKTGNQSITARFDGRYRVKMGDKLKLAMDKHKIHIFDKETQEAINKSLVYI